jgi:hypothetical protein
MPRWRSPGRSRRIIYYAALSSIALMCMVFGVVQQRAFLPHIGPHPFYTAEIDTDPGSPSLGTTVFGQDSDFSFVQRLAYRFVLAKFPDETACIVKSDRGVPNLNWQDIRSAKQLDVCVFNIAHARQSREATLAWFESAGMTASKRDFVYRRDDIMYFEDITRRYLSVTVTKLMDSHPVLFPLHNLFSIRRVIYVDFSEDGSVEYIKQEVSTK